jgi:hypothetical protein
MSPSSAIVNAVAALERASGLLEGLGRPQDADRCIIAATTLRAVFVEDLEEIASEDAEDH